jgi:hypothetical protein
MSKSQNFEQIDDGTEILSSDMTNTAWYSFDVVGSGDETQDMPSYLPDTGVGRLVNGEQASSMAVIDVLLVVSGYGLLRYTSRRSGKQQ